MNNKFDEKEVFAEEFNNTLKAFIERYPDRDKKLALMYFVEYKTEQEIADTLGYDIRTIRNNIPKISLMLKKTSAKLYSK